MKFISIIIFQFLLAIRGIVLAVSKLLALIFLIGAMGIIFMEEFKNVSVGVKIIAVMLGIFFYAYKLVLRLSGFLFRTGWYGNYTLSLMFVLTHLKIKK
jgi:hypothetical protein